VPFKKIIIFLFLAQSASALDLSLDDTQKFSQNEEMDAKISKHYGALNSQHQAFDLYYSYAERENKLLDMSYKRRGLTEQNNAINSFTSFRYNSSPLESKDSLNFGMNFTIKTDEK